MYCYSIVSYYLIRLVLNVFRSVSINHMSNSLPIRFRAIQAVSVGLWIHSIYVCPSCIHIRLTPYRISSRMKGMYISHTIDDFHNSSKRVQGLQHHYLNRIVSFHVLRGLVRCTKKSLRIQLMMNFRLDW